MLVINGKYNKAIVYTENIEESAIKQIETLCDQELERQQNQVMPMFTAESMYDGTTMTIEDKSFQILSASIGCGLK